MILFMNFIITYYESDGYGGLQGEPKEYPYEADSLKILGTHLDFYVSVHGYIITNIKILQ
jgi:hypothetical protein